MTPATAAPRYWRLTLGARGGAELQRHGIANPLIIGVGRDVEEIPRLASLLFPLCPHAHGLAALRAVRRALGAVPTSGGQCGAEDALAGAEALSTTVWRAALTWAPLIDEPPQPEPVRVARHVVEQLAGLLFPQGWDALDGAGAGLETASRARLSAQMDAALAAVSARQQRVYDAAQHHGQANAFARHLEAIQELRLHWDETLDGLEAWEAPSLSVYGCGSGEGRIATARGMLTHRVELDDGHVLNWTYDAPSDRILAPDGPLIREVRATRNLDEEGARWLIAAHDACVPCEVDSLRAVRHA